MKTTKYDKLKKDADRAAAKFLRAQEKEEDRNRACTARFLSKPSATRIKSN